MVRDEREKEDGRRKTGEEKGRAKGKRAQNPICRLCLSRNRYASDHVKIMPSNQRRRVRSSRGTRLEESVSHMMTTTRQRFRTLSLGRTVQNFRKKAELRG